MFLAEPEESGAYFRYRAQRDYRWPSILRAFGLQEHIQYVV